ncbi:MAG: S24/S26 family peptidase [Herbinix sp.]|nr:S24/S26 family peptidase [Herbinix sp.]
MNKSTIEAEIKENGFYYSTTVGDSMEPMLFNRQNIVLIVKPSELLKRYDIPMYKRPNGQYVLHRILKVREKDYIICGDNRWKTEIVPHDWILGVTKGYYKADTYIDCHKKKYLLYVHLWCDFFYIRCTILWLLALPKRIRRKLRW